MICVPGIVPGITTYALRDHKLVIDGQCCPGTDQTIKRQLTLRVIVISKNVASMTIVRWFTRDCSCDRYTTSITYSYHGSIPDIIRHDGISFHIITVMVLVTVLISAAITTATTTTTTTTTAAAVREINTTAAAAIICPAA